MVEFLLWFLSFSLVVSLEKSFFYSTHLCYVYKRIICKKTRKPYTENGSREGHLVYRHSVN